MDIEQERAVLARIARFVARLGVAVFAGPFISLLVAWACEEAGILSGWAFMHSNLALPTFLASVGLTFWVTGFLPLLRPRKPPSDAV
jgi:hypothetical protein